MRTSLIHHSSPFTPTPSPAGVASECCQDEGYACFKRPHVQYAQCRELPKGNCEDTAEWRCPGWADCPEDYESCYDAKCCKGHKVGCFKRATRQFAQCRRYEGNKEDCRSGDTWLCPGTWEQCSPTMHSCQESRCCDHADHKCCAPQPRRMPPPGRDR